MAVPFSSHPRRPVPTDEGTMLVAIRRQLPRSRGWGPQPSPRAVGAVVWLVTGRRWLVELYRVEAPWDDTLPEGDPLRRWVAPDRPTAEGWAEDVAAQLASGTRPHDTRPAGAPDAGLF